MKKILLIVVPVALLLGAAVFGIWKSGTKNQSAQAQSASREGLVGWWTMDMNDMSADGSKIYDKSGLGNNGTVTGTTTSTGKIGQARSFNGTSNCIRVLRSGNLTPTQGVTVSAWIKVNSSAANKTYIGSQVGANGIHLYDDGSNVGFYLGGDGASVSFGTRGVGQWNFYTATYDHANEKVYLNGKYVNQQARSTDITWSGGAGDNLIFGSADCSSGFSNSSIDDVRIYNRALSAQEVSQLYNAAKTSYVSAPVRASSTPSAAGSLVGWWTMDVNDMSANGAILYDKSGQGNNGTVVGTTTSTGKIGQSRTFNGTSDIVTTSASYTFAKLITPSDGTISMWLKPTGSSPSGANAYLTGRMALSASGAHLGITQANVSGSDQLWVWNFDGNEDRVGVSYNLNEWVHIVWLHTGGNLYIFKNGVLVGSVASGNTASLAGYVNIGYGISGGAKWQGLIDDVRIYNYALTAQEVSNLYNSAAQKYTAAPPREGLVGWWSMDTADMDSTGATIYDKSGQGNNGTVVGTTTSTGKIGQSRTFNGTNAYISKSSPSFINDTRGTISFWMKMSNLAVAQSIFVSSVDGATDDELRIDWGDPTNKKIQFALILNQGVNASLFSDSNIIIDNNWHLINFTSDGSTVRFYLDGVNKTLSVTGGTNSGQWFNTAADANIFTLGVLKRATPIQYFSGSIDDVRIYNRALSADEISNLYQSAKKNYVK